MMHVNEMVTDVVLNLNRWDFFYRTLYMLHDTRRKAEHSVLKTL